MLPNFTFLVSFLFLIKKDNYRGGDQFLDNDVNTNNHKLYFGTIFTYLAASSWCYLIFLMLFQ